MKKAVIYTRFSPRRNSDECKSCDIQEAYCEQYAAQKGYVVASCYRDEAMSGSEEDRPGMWAAIGKLKKGDILLVYNFDRLARSVRLTEMLRHTIKIKGARIEAVSGDIEGNSPEHEMIRQILSVFAEYLRKAGALRTRASMISHQQKGRNMSRYAPYGYQLDPENKCNLIPDKSEIKILNYIRKLLAKGIGYNAITRILNDEHPGSARGVKWYAKTILKIAKRPKTKYEE